MQSASKPPKKKQAHPPKAEGEVPLQKPLAQLALQMLQLYQPAVHGPALRARLECELAASEPRRRGHNKRSSVQPTPKAEVRRARPDLIKPLSSNSKPSIGKEQIDCGTTPPPKRWQARLGGLRQFTCCVLPRWQPTKAASQLRVVFLVRPKAGAKAQICQPKARLWFQPFWGMRPALRASAL